MRREWSQVEPACVDLAQALPVAGGVSVGPCVAPIENRIEERALDSGFAAQAATSAQRIGQRNQARIRLAVDASGFVQQALLGGSRVAEFEQQCCCVDQFVVLARVRDCFRTLRPIYQCRPVASSYRNCYHEDMVGALHAVCSDARHS